MLPMELLPMFIMNFFNYLRFKDWFNGALSLEHSNEHPNMRIIHGKVAVFLGQWVSEIKDDAKRPVYCALIRLLQGKDLSVKVSVNLIDIYWIGY